MDLVLWGIRWSGVLLGLAVAVVNFWFVIRCSGSPKRMYRLFVGFCGLYFAGIYLAVISGVSAYALKSGLMTIGGVAMLLLLNIAEVILERRGC